MSDKERVRLEYLLNEREAGQVLGVSAEGMRGWRQRGEGPPWKRIGKRFIRYDPAALRRWIEDQGAAEVNRG
jgi:hypothetical protein